MLGNLIGQPLDQRGKLLDLGGERLGCRQRLVEHRIDLHLDGAEPAVELGDLARHVAGAARQVGDLVAHFGTIAKTGRNGVVDHQRGENAECHQEGFGSGQAEAKIDDDADRAGDEHHADRDENGADAHHAEPRLTPPPNSRAARTIRPRTIAVSTSAARPQVRCRQSRCRQVLQPSPAAKSCCPEVRCPEGRGSVAKLLAAFYNSKPGRPRRQTAMT